MLRTLHPNAALCSSKESYHANMLHLWTEVPISVRIIAMGIQTFFELCSTLCRVLTGKLQLGLVWQEPNIREVAYHLGVSCQTYRSKKLWEDNVDNDDETHFVIELALNRQQTSKETRYLRGMFSPEGSDDNACSSLWRVRCKPENSRRLYNNQSGNYALCGVPGNEMKIIDIAQRGWGNLRWARRGCRSHVQSGHFHDTQSLY